jgi:hypothetical protein
LFKKRSDGKGESSAHPADPTKAWEKESVRQKFKTLDPQDWSSPKPENHTRFVCISGKISI